MGARPTWDVNDGDSAALLSVNLHLENKHQIPDESNLASSAGSSLDDYVEIYFHHFHPSWPFLHLSTFNPTTEPGVLVQSVMMVQVTNCIVFS